MEQPDLNFDGNLSGASVTAGGRASSEGEHAPFQGKTRRSRHASYTGAREANKTRGEKQSIYKQLLMNQGPFTDQEAAGILGWPLSSVNSIRASFGERVVPIGFEPSPFGRAKRTKWRWR